MVYVIILSVQRSLTIGAQATLIFVHLPYLFNRVVATGVPNSSPSPMLPSAANFRIERFVQTFLVFISDTGSVIQSYLLRVELFITGGCGIRTRLARLHTAIVGGAAFWELLQAFSFQALIAPLQAFWRRRVYALVMALDELYGPPFDPSKSTYVFGRNSSLTPAAAFAETIIFVYSKIGKVVRILLQRSLFLVAGARVLVASLAYYYLSNFNTIPIPMHRMRGFS